MQIIRSDNQYIKVDPEPCDSGYVWGYRWHRNEQQWSERCMRYKIERFALCTDNDLPGPLPPVDVL